MPADGAQAAPDVTFNVPAGLDRMNVDMIWPDALNGAILSYTLTDPSGRLRQISYDYGTTGAAGRIGTVPDIGHTEVANPEAGTWTAHIKWANGRAHLQSLPNVPGTYRGTVSLRATGENWITSAAVPTTTLASRTWVTIPLQVDVPERSRRSPRDGAVRGRQRRQDASSRSLAGRSSRPTAASSTRTSSPRSAVAPARSARSTSTCRPDARTSA